MKHIARTEPIQIQNKDPPQPLRALICRPKVQVITSCLQLALDHAESAHVGRLEALLYTACDLAFLAWMMARACLSLTMGLIESCAMGAQL